MPGGVAEDSVRSLPLQNVDELRQFVQATGGSIDNEVCRFDSG